jgi:uncharacterized membrane protein (UPF0127 family)
MPRRARIVNETRGTVLAERAELATSTWSRGRGLLGRRELPAGAGLIISPCNSVHCFFMAFSIDVIYVDRAYRVVRLAPDLRPFRVGPIVLSARDVIELPVGTIPATGTQVGDQLRVEIDEAAGG